MRRQKAGNCTMLVRKKNSGRNKRADVKVVYAELSLPQSQGSRVYSTRATERKALMASTFGWE